MTATTQANFVVTRESLMHHVRSLEGRIRDLKRTGVLAQERADELAETIGESVLDEPERADELKAEYARAAAEPTIVAKTIAAAEPRLDAAKRAVLEFDAEQIAVELKSARRELEEHEAETAKLLAVLERHEGPGEFVRLGAIEFEKEMAILPAGTYGTFKNEKAGPWKSDPLRNRVTLLELQEGVLRDVAAGVDPSHRFHRIADPRNAGALYDGTPISNLYPASVRGPEALIQASPYTPLFS